MGNLMWVNTFNSWDVMQNTIGVHVEDLEVHNA